MTFDGMTASAFARKMRNEGADQAAIVDALVAKGQLRRRAKCIAWCIFARPQTTKNYRPRRYASRSTPVRLFLMHLETLDAAAERRGISRKEVMERLLTVIAEEGMVDTVLDDGKFGEVAA
ncbi:MAG: hypothetical protein K2Y29_17920 [Beijerinckiaceae bacterium]|nr:hypothetical protein [Beijerinckiaceae bacterium]